MASLPSYRWLTASAGLLASSAVAWVTGNLLAVSAGWLLVFVPAAFAGCMCFGTLLRSLGVPIRTNPKGHRESPCEFGPPRHPNEGLLNPATGLFITRAGIDLSGNSYGIGSGEKH